jgi:CubicO group peptidase (beta-lactamase class C family)
VLHDRFIFYQNFPNLDFCWFWGNETRLELIKRMRYVAVEPKMPANVNYNNAMYAVAGEAAARVAGVPFEKLVRDKIFRPLGLSNTGFSMTDMSESSNFAVPFLADSYEDATAGRFTELPLDNAIQKTAAAGDIYSSALDLSRWGQVIMKGGNQNGKQVLSKEGIEATLSAHTILVPAIHDPEFPLSLQYGMGWALNSYKGNNFYEHSK